MVDLCFDGYALVSVSAPLLSLALTAAKFFEIPISGLHNLSYAWALAPLTIWFFVAYVRRRAIKNRGLKVAELKKFYVELGPLIDRVLPKDMSPPDFESYRSETNKWVQRSAEWIFTNMGEAARARFLDRTGIVAAYYSGAINETHNNIIGNLIKFRQNLLALIEKDVWDR